MKNATLSPLEQKIYFAARDAKEGVITLDVIKSWKLTDEATLRLIIHNMQKKGWLIRLKRGIYLIGELGKVVISDPFVISTYIFNGYVAFSSALYIHRLTDIIPFDIYVATESKIGIKVIGNYSFKALPLGKRAFGSEKLGNYVVSTVPKTIYDCLHKPLLAGGLPAVLKAIFEARMGRSQWKEFLYYAKRFEKDSFYQRLGYLLSLLPRKTPEIKEIILLCKKRVKSKTYLLGRKNGVYFKEWKIIDNEGRERLLSWWYHG